MLMLGTLRAWKHSVLLGALRADRAALVVDGRRGSSRGKYIDEYSVRGDELDHVELSSADVLAVRS